MKFVNQSAPEQLFFDQLGGNIMPLYRAYGNVNSFNNLGVRAYCCDWICNRATLDGSTLDGSTLDKGDISAFSHLLYRPLRFSLSLFCWLVQHADEQLSREERIFTPPHFSQFQKLFPSRYLFFSMYRNYLSMLAPAAGGIYI
jgi:hypothetical protein